VLDPNIADLCNRICAQPRHESMMPASTVVSVVLSVQSANTLTCVRKHLKKAVCFILLFFANIYLQKDKLFSHI